MGGGEGASPSKKGKFIMSKSTNFNYKLKCLIILINAKLASCCYSVIIQGCYDLVIF